MATSKEIQTINAIRKAAKKIEKSENYQWGHMGACNCGHLAQELTPYTKAEIHQYAMRKYGDWTDQVRDYCGESAMPFDLVISAMLQAGLSQQDLIDLERLKNQEVLRMLDPEERNLQHNKKEDVAKYMLAWADMLENKLIEKVDIEEIQSIKRDNEKIIA